MGAGSGHIQLEVDDGGSTTSKSNRIDDAPISNIHPVHLNPNLPCRLTTPFLTTTTLSPAWIESMDDWGGPEAPARLPNPTACHWPARSSSHQFFSLLEPHPLEFELIIISFLFHFPPCPSLPSALLYAASSLAPPLVCPSPRLLAATQRSRDGTLPPPPHHRTLMPPRRTAFTQGLVRRLLSALLRFTR